jgi:hypothetical protein
MILFANTLHGNARAWYYSLLDASITSMDQFEEVFLEKWGIKSEDIPKLQKKFEDIKQNENENLFDFHSRFDGTLHQIPRAHHPDEECVVHIYTHAILAHLGFPSIEGPQRHSMNLMAWLKKLKIISSHQG